MRVLPFVLTGLVLVGCASSQPYTGQDRRDVRRAYGLLNPVYVDFKVAFHRNNLSGMTGDYQQERRICRIVDAVDKRDTIDPNTNLFQASAVLDNMCNDIESVYAGWQKLHHMKFDKGIVPAFLGEAFLGSDKSLKKMGHFLARPAELS